MTLAYLDFDLEIGPPTGQSYPVTVLYSPAGVARATMQWTLGELALENRLKDLQIALLSSGGVRRTVLTPAETAVQRFGVELFDLLFTGEVRNRYDVKSGARPAPRQGRTHQAAPPIAPPGQSPLGISA